ncbi:MULTISPECIES: hypothetical protein [unclassified Clostridium]|uniref:hypothetical protein n=1 Tax=unclassified Clostridium TaxID=2614128 RepID=UPI0013F8AE13|nr:MULTISPECIES: hypothetical protein [unclassified Clostridium]MBN1045513.1 hypothetical protein [Clostridium botulinum]MBN1052233.1 hypothetical protein [Clostridium botulinum]NFR85772.1 hypothetical protein [Clostridium botulinum]NFR91406.1 hypothetical protein [Clostridium botulinum]NFT99303.1 hypothetical protein [Clostridium botulinum]
MDAKCCKCKEFWNISVKAQIPKSGYICPKCRAKEAKDIEKAREARKGRVTSVLLKNRQRVHA